MEHALMILAILSLSLYAMENNFIDRCFKKLEKTPEGKYIYPFIQTIIYAKK